MEATAWPVCDADHRLSFLVVYWLHEDYTGSVLKENCAGFGERMDAFRDWRSSHCPTRLPFRINSLS